MNEHLRAHADRLTRELTAFRSFEQLLTARGNYRPTLMCNSADRSGTDGCRTTYLADLYDAEQEHRGDERRAYRGCVWERAAGERVHGRQMVAVSA